MDTAGLNAGDEGAEANTGSKSHELDFELEARTAVVPFLLGPEEEPEVWGEMKRGVVGGDVPEAELYAGEDMVGERAREAKALGMT